MKKPKYLLWIILLLLAATGILGACDGTGSLSLNRNVISTGIWKCDYNLSNDETVYINSSTHLSVRWVTVRDSYGDGGSDEWRSSDDSIAKIDQNYKSIKFLQPGRVTVTVTHKKYTNHKATKTFEVLPIPDVESVKVSIESFYCPANASTENEFYAGARLWLTADTVFAGLDSTLIVATWSVSDPDVGYINTLGGGVWDEKINLVLLKAGELTVSFVSVANPAITASLTIAILPQPLQCIEIDHVNINSCPVGLSEGTTVYVGANVTIWATYTIHTGSAVEDNWTVNDPDMVLKLNYSPPSWVFLKPGIVTLTVTSNSYEHKPSASITFTVLPIS